MKKPDSSVNVCWCFDEHKFRRPNSTSQRARAQNTEANQKWIVTENVNQFRCVVDERIENHIIGTTASRY